MKISTLSDLLDAVYKTETAVIRPWIGHVTDREIQLLEGYTQLRTDYVRQEKWPLHKSGVDVDTYDVAAKSVYVLAHYGNQVTAGMRLTKVTSLLGSLSYDMWQNALERKQFDKRFLASKALHDAVDNNELWDVTRLIAATSVHGEYTHRDKAFSRISLFKIMSAGVAVAAPSDKSVWIFTISERMYRYMKRNNIDAHVIAHGRISETDPGESYLCMIYPRHAFDGMKKKNPPVYILAKQVFSSHAKVH